MIFLSCCFSDEEKVFIFERICNPESEKYYQRDILEINRKS